MDREVALLEQARSHARPSHGHVLLFHTSALDAGVEVLTFTPRVFIRMVGEFGIQDVRWKFTIGRIGIECWNMARATQRIVERRLSERDR